MTSKPAYATVATRAQAFLLPGLTGLWEYATASSVRSCTEKQCKPIWRRVQGSHRERDYFVYGDTLAYGLRALWEAGAPVNDITSLYITFASFKSTHQKAVAYDGRVAFAGYIIAPSRAPDHYSAYYDVVTIGILHSLRKSIAPADFDRAREVLHAMPKDASLLTWRMNFDLSLVRSEFVDLSTLANLGEALLQN